MRAQSFYISLKLRDGGLSREIGIQHGNMLDGGGSRGLAVGKATVGEALEEEAVGVERDGLSHRPNPYNLGGAGEEL